MCRYNGLMLFVFKNKDAKHHQSIPIYLGFNLCQRVHRKGEDTGMSMLTRARFFLVKFFLCCLSHHGELKLEYRNRVRQRGASACQIVP